MHHLNVNLLLFGALNTICPIATARVSVFPLNDPYAGTPFLRFRFKDKEKDDAIYTQIKAVIEGFQGHLQWCMVTRDDAPNFLILPSYFYSGGKVRDFPKDFTDAQEVIAARAIIDKAVLDIPELSASLKNAFGEPHSTAS
jgi:hypothetical protein